MDNLEQLSIKRNIQYGQSVHIFYNIPAIIDCEVNGFE